MKINIRLLNLNEGELANQVYNAAYGNIRPYNNFEWEFIKGPCGQAIYVIAEDLDKIGNQIIGTQCAIPLEFIDKSGTVVLTAKSEDTFVDPAYRGQKLFEKMYDLLFEECIKKGIKYIWGFTYAKKPFIKIGFKIPFDTLQGLMVIDLKESYQYFSKLNPENRWKEKLKIAGMVLYSFIRTTLFKKGSRSVAIEKMADLNISKQELIENILSLDSVNYSLNQNESYLRWRIISNPYSNNYVYYFNKGKYCITLNRRDEGFTYIEEMLFDSSLNAEQKVNLLLSILKDFNLNCKTSCFRFWGFENNKYNESEIDLLKKVGFLFVKKGTSFVWKDLTLGKGKIKVSDILMSRIYTQGNR